MPAPICPWQPSNVPIEITRELDRRKINRSFNFKSNASVTWGKDGDFNAYRGPMVSWIRLCSNSAGHPVVPTQLDNYGNPICDKQRFVLYSGKGFYDTYGFTPPKNVGGAKQQIIGYTPGTFINGAPGDPHIIENSLTAPVDERSNYPIHVPSPEISRMEVTVQKELIRRVQIEWVCFSFKQLQYMTPYFLVPGITCMLEWGWNHYNVKSLVDLSNIGQMRSLWDNSYPLYTNNILKSNGNYDVVYGIITNFNWSIEGNKIICTTEITSKDRLYAGIAKDYGLSVVNKDDASKNGTFKSLKDFLNVDQTIQNLRNLVTNSPVVSGTTIKLVKTNPKQDIWYDILNPLLTPSTNTGNPELAADQIGMRLPHVFGIFSGRPKDAYTQKENFGTPKAGDFDQKIQENDPNNFWINMGMVVAILNHFSAIPSGAKNGNKAFEVDVQNSIIGGHPNLVSCDSRVLVPNYQAPKFLYGSVGTTDNITLKNINTGEGNPKEPYSYQILRPIPIGSSLQNKKLSTICYQQGKCYRDDLDSIINYNRYRYADITSVGNFSQLLSSFSFPSQFNSDEPLPVSSRNLGGDKLQKDYSGLLSNIYISFSAFKSAVEDDSNASYPDIYKAILQVLMDAVDGFWDLVLIEVDGVLTITDKKYISKYAMDEQTDRVYSFDYSDADSIIKSLKFRPVMSDAQATRAIYGSANNKNSKYQYVDKNDLLDYKFRDSVIGTPEDKSQGDPNGLDRRTTALQEQEDLIRTFQKINSAGDDGTLQMALNPNRQGVSAPDGSKPDMKEYVKLVMGGAGGQQLLRLLLNDSDYDNNPRYCAVQPGITLEITLQGIGGLRTFQYFLVKNLPEPYSDRNIIFRITDVHQTLEAGTWETTIRAQLHPLTGYIKTRVKGPYEDQPTGWLPDNSTI